MLMWGNRFWNGSHAIPQHRGMVFTKLKEEPAIWF